MRTYQTETIQKEVTTLKVLTCDICKKVATKTDGNWSSGYYERAEIEVSYNQGHYYPDGGYGTKIEIDICPNCFCERLIPFLVKEGAEISEQEWDY